MTHPATASGPEVTVALRKLLEAKDAAVRAVVAGPARGPASRPAIVVNVTVHPDATASITSGYADALAATITEALEKHQGGTR